MTAQCFWEYAYSHSGCEDRSLHRLILDPHSCDRLVLWCRTSKGKGQEINTHAYKWQYYRGHRLRERYTFLHLHDCIRLGNHKGAPCGLERCRQLRYIPSCVHIMGCCDRAVAVGQETTFYWLAHHAFLLLLSSLGTMMQKASHRIKMGPTSWWVVLCFTEKKQILNQWVLAETQQ